MKIEELIGDLLLRTNCVVIPDFGGFISNTKPAYIDYSKGVVHPPTKSVTFNRYLTNNDGLLVSEFARLKQLDYLASSAEIARFVSTTKGKLTKGKRITFEKVGYLYRDTGGNLCFEQDRFFNLLMEAYGMGSVQFVPANSITSVSEPSTKIESAQDTPVTPIVPIKKKNQFNRIAKYAAAAALLPVVFYSFWIPSHTDVLKSGVLYTEDFNPLKTGGEAIYLKKEVADISINRVENEVDSFGSLVSSLPESVSVISFELNEDTFIPVRVRKEPPSTPTISNKSGYHLIVGCFGEKSNAENLVSVLNEKGLQAQIIDVHNGLHRVSAQQGGSKNELFEARETLKNMGYSSWFLKR